MIAGISTVLLMAMTSLAFDMMEIVPDRQIAAQIGKELVLSCRTSGCEVAPTFRWRPQLDRPVGGTVTEEGSSSFLTMKRVTFENAQEYICIATCGDDKKQKRVKIDVYSFPDDPVIEISSLLILGKQAEVTCRVPNVYPSDRLVISLKRGEELIDEREFFEDSAPQSLQTKSLRAFFTPTEEDIGKDISCIAELPINDMEFEPKERQTTQKLNIAVFSSTISPSTFSASSISPSMTFSPPTTPSPTTPPPTISASTDRPEHITEMEDFTTLSIPYSTPHQKTDDRKNQQENETSTAAKDTVFTLYRTLKNDTITYAVSVLDDIRNGTEEVIVIARREEMDYLTTAIIVAASLVTVAGPVTAVLLYISRKAKINGSYSLVNSPEPKV